MNVFVYLPFFRVDSLEGKRYVGIQLQKMIDPDVDAVHFERQMRYYERKLFVMKYARMSNAIIETHL